MTEMKSSLTPEELAQKLFDARVLFHSLRDQFLCSVNDIEQRIEWENFSEEAYERQMDYLGFIGIMCSDIEKILMEQHVENEIYDCGYSYRKRAETRNKSNQPAA